MRHLNLSARFNCANWFVLYGELTCTRRESTEHTRERAVKRADAHKPPTVDGILVGCARAACVCGEMRVSEEN